MGELEKLHKSLLDNNYDVPEDYSSFEYTLTLPGDEGYQNRVQLWKSLQKNNFDVPDNYEDFRDTLFGVQEAKPANKTAEKPDTVAVGSQPAKPTGTVRAENGMTFTEGGLDSLEQGYKPEYVQTDAVPQRTQPIDLSRPEEYQIEKPFVEGAQDAQQLAQSPELNKYWANRQQEAMRRTMQPEDSAFNFEYRQQAWKEAAEAEAARKMNRGEFDAANKQRFNELYDRVVAPVFAEERAAGEQRAKDEVRERIRREIAGEEMPQNVAGAMSGIGRAFQTSVAVERETDPERIAANTLKRVQGDEAFGDYVLARMGIVGGTDEHSDGNDSPQLTEREKKFMQMLFARENGEVADQMIQRIYDQYKAEGAPKSALEYIAGKAFHENFVASLYDALVRRAANSRGIRDKLRAMAREEYGQNANLATQIAGGAAPFAVDVMTGGFYVPGIAGGLASQLAMKGGSKLLSRAVTKKLSERAAARGLEDAALKEAAAGGADIAERYLASNSPIMNVVVRSIGSAANFSTFETQSELIKQLGEGKFDAGQLFNQAVHGAALGGIMGVAGGAIANATKRSGLAGRIAGDIAGFGTEAGIFAAANGIEKAIEDGVNITDVNWGDITGQALIMVAGMKVGGHAVHGVGSVIKKGVKQSVTDLANRYRKSKDYGMQLNQRDIDELKQAGYDFSDIFKGLGELGKMAPESATVRRTATEYGVDSEGNGRKRDTESKEAYVDEDAFNAMLSNPEIMSSTKRKLIYMATGKVTNLEPLFGADLIVDDNGKASIVTKNAVGNPIEVKEFDSKEKAQQAYDIVQNVARLNTINGLKKIAKESGFDDVDDLAKGRTKEQTGYDPDAAALGLTPGKKDRKEGDIVPEGHMDAEDVLDAYIKNLQDVYAERLNENMRRLSEMPPAEPDADATGTVAVGAAGGTGGGVQRSERRQAAYEKGAGAVADESQVPGMTYDSQMATARLMAQMPDDDARAAFIRKMIVHAAENGNFDAAEQVFAKYRQELSDKQAEAVEDYLDAYTSQAGMQDAISQEQVEYEEQMRAEVANKSDEQGNVTELLMKDGSTAYLKNGDLNAYHGQLIVTTEDGEQKQVSTADVAEVVGSQSAEDVVVAMTSQHTEQMRQMYEGLANGTVLREGQEVDLAIGGTMMHGTMLGYDATGNPVIQFEDGSRMPMRPDQVSAAIQEANNLKIQQVLTEEQEADAVRQRTERFNAGIVGYAQGTPNVSAKDTKPEVAAEYLLSQTGLDGQTVERSKVLGDIQTQIEQLVNGQQQMLQALQQARNNMAMAEEGDEQYQQTAAVIQQLEPQLEDMKAQQRKWGEIRQAMMNNEERQKFESGRIKAVGQAQSKSLKEAQGQNLAAEPQGTIPSGKELVEQYPERTDGESFVDGKRKEIAQQYREDVYPKYDDIQKTLDDYQKGLIELSADEIKELTDAQAVLSMQMNQLVEQQNQWKKLASDINKLYGAQERKNMTPHELALNRLQTETDKNKKIKLAQEAFKDDPEALAMLENLEPQDVNEWVAAHLGAGSINWEGLQRGEHKVRGLISYFGDDKRRGLDKNSDTYAFNYFLAPTGEGKGVDEVVHAIAEGSPYTTEEVADALYNMLAQATKPTDISHYIENSRIAEAERIYEQNLDRQREQELEAQLEAENDAIREMTGMEPEEYDAYMADLEQRLAEQAGYRNSEEYYNNVAEYERRAKEGSIGGSQEAGTLGLQEQEGRPADAEANAERRTREADAEPVGTENISEKQEKEEKSEENFPARLAAAKEEVNTEPTEEQKKAGNYKMGHISFGGYRMSIENPKGSTRSGVDKSGKPWSVEMKDTYGYIGQKYGADGDHLDFFINDDADLDTWNGRVFVIDQKNEDGTFDEHKVMYGYPTWGQARRAYERNYEPGWWDKHVMQMTGVKKDKFDKWLADSDHKTKPFHEYYRTKMLTDVVNDNVDQVLADVRERKNKPAGEAAGTVASFKPGELTKKSIDELKQVRKKAKQDLSTARVILGTIDSIKGTENEKNLQTKIAQAEADIAAIDAEIEKKEAAARQRAEQQEIGFAMTDQLEGMGFDVTTDTKEMRKARKQAEQDKSEEGKLRHFETPDGKLYGFVYKGKMYLDPTKIDAELPIHEYAHPWCEAFRRLNPEGWKNIVGLMKGDKETWGFVKAMNPDLKDEDDIAEEMIAKFSGKRGQQRAEAEYQRMNGKDPDYKSKWNNIWKNISKAIQDFWKQVGDFLHIKYESAEQVYDQVVRDFANKMNPRKRVEDWLKERDDAYMQAVEAGDDTKAKEIFDEALRENIGNGITPFVAVDGYRGKMQKLAHAIKERDPKVIAEVADMMTPLIPKDAVLVPAPSHTGKATDMLDLAQAISERTGAPVADVLTSKERGSQYEAKKAGKPLSTLELGITMQGELPEGKMPVVIDNVVDSGNTAEACVKALGKGIVASLADSAERYKHVASLKSAEPVVKDRNGNVVPLSKRFEITGKYLEKADNLAAKPQDTEQDEVATMVGEDGAEPIVAQDADAIIHEMQRRKEVAEDKKLADDILKKYLSAKPKGTEQAVRQRATKAVLKAMDNAGVPYKVVSKAEEKEMLKVFSMMNQAPIKEFARRSDIRATTAHGRGPYIIYNMSDPFGVPMYFEKQSTAKYALKGLKQMAPEGDWEIMYIGWADENAAAEQQRTLKDAANLNPELKTTITLEDGRTVQFMFEGDAEAEPTDKPIFVSNAMKAVEGIKQEKATPEQWLAMIQKNGGLKAGEDKWIGLSDWLKEQKGSVTKKDVMDFISQNQIQVEEQYYAEGVPEEAQKKLEEFNEEFEDLLKMEQESAEPDVSEEDDWVDAAFNDMVDRYGDDFRQAFDYSKVNGKWELQPAMNWNDELSGEARYYLGIENGTERPINNTRLDYTTEGLDNKREIALTVPTVEPYNEGDEVHFGDAGEGRAVAWIRFGETTDADGKKVLVIDEIQSKRHQDAREHGYKNLKEKELAVKKAEKELAEANKKYVEATRDIVKQWENDEITEEQAKAIINEKYGDLHDDVVKAEEALAVAKENAAADFAAIPDAPFEKNWHELAMKRMLRYAAENGYDKIAWTKGEHQAERYNLSNVVSGIEVSKWGEDINGGQLDIELGYQGPSSYVPKNDVEKAIKEYIEYCMSNGESFALSAAYAHNQITDAPNESAGWTHETVDKVADAIEADMTRRNEARSVLIDLKDGDLIDLTVDKDGKILNSSENEFEGKSLSDVVGKDLAITIIGKDGKGKIGTDGLRIGGEGMKGFYDEILPRFMDKYGKKWGVKVGEVELPGLDGRTAENPLTMWSIDVTPEMKESVMQGQVMFQKEGKKLLGWSDGKQVYLTKDGLNPNTPLHETTHIWDNWCMKEQPELWKKLVAAMKKTAMWEEISKNPNYRGIWGDDDKMASEVHARLSGAAGEDEFMKAAFKKDTPKSIINEVKSALRKFWEAVLRLFGKKTKTIGDDWSSLDAIVRMPIRDLVGEDFEKVMKAAGENKQEAMFAGEKEAADAAGTVADTHTLMGVHNISEDKLKKVLKAGGLANPSLAVIDTKKGMHNGFGEISLIPKSALIDSKTGRNAGTYLGDAYTPTYPTVETSLSEKGRAHITEIAKAAAGDDEQLMHHLRGNLKDYIEGNGSRLHYLFLLQTGRNPKPAMKRLNYSEDAYNELKDMIDGDILDKRELTQEENDRIMNAMLNERLAKYGDKLTPEKREAIEKNFRDNNVGKDGKLFFSKWYTFVEALSHDARQRKNPTIDWYGTDLEAQNRVNDERLYNEYEEWKKNLLNDEDINEELFAGYDRNGYRKTVPNTVENASRLMNKEADVNSYDSSGIGATRSTLLKKVSTLAEIRKNKDKIGLDSDAEQAVKDASDKLFEIIQELSDMQKISDNPFMNNDYAEARLQEAFGKKNPLKHLRDEYGYDIADDSDLGQRINEFMNTVKDLPVKYFETKFKRPVGLNEFAVAVVPESTSPEVIKALKDAGLDVRTYDASDEKTANENRQKVAMDAVSGRDDILFRHSTPEVEKLNSEFNAKLQEQIDGKLPKDYTYQLGKPSVPLLSTGIPNVPILMQANVLARKSKDHAHPYGLEEAKDLVRHIQKPLAIFEYGDKEQAQNLMVGIHQAFDQEEGRQFLVGLALEPVVKGKKLEYNSVRNVFPKNFHDWIHWINQGKLLRADGKKEIEAIIDALRINPVDHITIDDLNDAAKILNNFENPKLSEEKLRELFPEQVEAAERAAEMLGGLKVVFESEASEGGTLGWYDPNDHSVHLVLPENADVNETVRTVCHEKLGHEGLVALLGSQEGVNKFGTFIFRSAGKTLRQRILERADEEGYSWSDPLRLSKAAQEVFADIAADGPATEEEFSLWDKVKHYIIRACKAIGLKVRGLLNDHDLRYYVLKTGEALKKWNQMDETARENLATQATRHDIMRSRNGKPRQRRGESMASYMQRLTEWEKWRVARQTAKDNGDPEPTEEQFHEQAEAEYKQALQEWKGRNGIPAGEAAGTGAFPRRRDGESPQEYAVRVAEYEANNDLWQTAPSYMDFMRKASDDYRQAYLEWRLRYDLEEEATVDQRLYEGDVEPEPTFTDAEEEARAQAELDLADAMGIEVDEEGAKRHAKLAVIERRKNMESANAEDAIWVYDFVKMTDEVAKDLAAKLQGTVTGKELRAALPFLIEADRRRENMQAEKEDAIVAINMSDAIQKAHSTLSLENLDQIGAEVNALEAAWQDKQSNPNQLADMAYREAARALADKLNSLNSQYVGYEPLFADDVMQIRSLLVNAMAAGGGEVMPASAARFDGIPEVKQLMDHIKEWYDEFFALLEDAGLRGDAGYIEEGYVNHVWDKEKSDPKAWEKFVENRQRTKSPNMRHREIDTYMDGIKVGLVPKYTDIADMIAHYSRQNNEAIANSRFLDDFKGVYVRELNDEGEVTAVLPMVMLENPESFIRERYAQYNVPGVGDVYVLKHVQKRFANVFGTMRTPDAADWLSKLGAGYDITSSTAKKIQLALSGFHALALFEVDVAQNNPMTAMKHLLKYIIADSIKTGTLPAYAHPEDFKLAAEHLVQLGATEDYAAADVNAITQKLRDTFKGMYESDEAWKKAVGVAGSPAAIMMDWINKGFDTVLWNYLHDGLKLSAFKELAKQVDRRVEKQGLDEKMRNQLLDEAGQYVNDMFGGQYWELLNVSPATLKWMRRLFLSPDWLVSTQRHFFANFGFGSVYSDGGFREYVKYNMDNIKRLFGADVPQNELRRLRSKNAKYCYMVGAIIWWGLFYNAINALCRWKDEQDEKDKADEIRKTDPNYKSPYELAYPDGMKWYDYTMYGNAIGQQTHLFTGRYADGTETYVRWGKQFREFPELFMGRHGAEFPAPLIQRMMSKANPNIGTVIDFLGAQNIGGFNGSYENKELREKYGKTVATLAATARHFIPFGMPTQAEKEYKLMDFFMPSSKGFSRYKARDYFETFILDGNWEGIEATYKACVMNGVDAEAGLNAAISSIKATQRKELSDGVTDLTTATQKFDAATEPKERALYLNKIKKYLKDGDYKQLTREEAMDKIRNFMDGTDVSEKENVRYTMLATSADIIAEEKLKDLGRKAKQIKKELEAKKSSPEYDAMKQRYGTWLKVDKIVGKATRAISKSKKQLGAMNEDSIMNSIRETVKEAQDKIDELQAVE